MFTESEQLKDVVVTISVVNYDDDNQPYAATYVYRYDLEGDPHEFISHLESSKQLIEGGQIGAQ